ncbi:ABC transporter ATP-binding protein [Pectinatus sottacetonis]|uniref:ABC transporter ATP-binding protein n=1 Tax=Pectinatus sottacetonis TaxID=1002795 RepID=UPI0018C6EF6D|nr:ABC transporter ATP-binding protein [Pectinatus sottacetonis]
MKIELKHIYKNFGGQAIISDLSMIIEEHSFTVILGPSGCGKTTLLRMIAGLEQPDSGDILFDDKLVFSKENNIFIPPEKRDLGFVFQDMALWPHMTVYNNVAFGLRMKKKKNTIPQIVPDILHAVHMEHFSERYPDQLSGGQQQRVALARAIACTTSCILFDEPMSALDAILRIEMRKELQRLAAKFHVTSILVTHDQEEAMSMADHIAVLSSGILQQYNTPRSIYENPATLFTASFIGKSNWLGENQMFRPESIHMSRQQGDLSFRTEVENVHYMGGYYELNLLYRDKIWTIYTDSQREKGSIINIYISPNSIININGGKKN